jgi:hypothetical protein
MSLVQSDNTSNEVEGLRMEAEEIDHNHEQNDIRMMAEGLGLTMNEEDIQLALVSDALQNSIRMDAEERKRKEEEEIKRKEEEEEEEAEEDIFNNDHNQEKSITNKSQEQNQEHVHFGEDYLEFKRRKQEELSTQVKTKAVIGLASDDIDGQALFEIGKVIKRGRKSKKHKKKISTV